MPRSLISALDVIARGAPSAPALRWRDCRWSYGDLRHAIRAASSAIISSGLPCGSHIALLMRNSPQYVASYHGILASGCVVVPLNPHERSVVLANQVGHSGATLVIGDPAHGEWPSLAALLKRARIAMLEVPTHDGSDALERFASELGARAAASHERSPQVSAGHLAAIVYTSGTTGAPKGVMLSHGNLHHNAEAIIKYLGLNASDRGLCVLPFPFAFGNSVLQSHLLAGAELLIDDNFAFPHLTLKRMRHEGVTGFAGVPSTFALLLSRCRPPDFNLPDLRYVAQAGGAMPLALLDRLRHLLPRTQIYVMYGQTEATARITYLPPSLVESKRGSVGIPISGVEVEIRRDASAVPRGESGEICVRGANVMLGYWKDAAATSCALRDEWLHTGDIGHIDEDGCLYIEGRATDTIKVGAYRVTPLEIEEVIMELASVEEVAVVGIPDDTLGQAVKAVVVRKPNKAINALEVKAHCLNNLASYKVPKIVEFVDELPRTSTGKIQRFRTIANVESRHD